MQSPSSRQENQRKPVQPESLIQKGYGTGRQLQMAGSMEGPMMVRILPCPAPAPPRAHQRRCPPGPVFVLQRRHNIANGQCHPPQHRQRPMSPKLRMTARQRTRAPARRAGARVRVLHTREPTTRARARALISRNTQLAPTAAASSAPNGRCAFSPGPPSPDSDPRPGPKQTDIVMTNYGARAASAEFGLVRGGLGAPGAPASGAPVAAART